MCPASYPRLSPTRLLHDDKVYSYVPCTYHGTPTLLVAGLFESDRTHSPTSRNLLIRACRGGMQ